MSMLIINTMLILAIMFVFLKHPLSLGVTLLIQTISVAILTGMMSVNYWFSYMLFLIMIGGMLILFMYMTSVASNEKFKFSIKLFIIVTPVFLITSFFIISDAFFFDIILKNDLMDQKNNQNFNLSLNKFINFPLNSIFYLIISYLLVTLIMVVKITDIRSGPLRQMN
uniref:NADH-ubiquinone oxidoreductase chain 6 n=1 Tax=Pterolophia sp. ZJY-2019 TaxID=2604362 RepID=A0A5B9RH43_9CUCU|nr:NADH dehydrogenase subunit 6 [Pterolophia sp. ZJY-2019]QEG58703.1 NADH dehydrogenase subunit 6 [Pterolophia sp. ZJY-2019]